MTKKNDIVVRKAFIRLAAPGESDIIDSFDVDLNVTNIISKSYSDLFANKRWSIQFTCRDTADSIIYQADTFVLIPAENTASVNMSVAPIYFQLRLTCADIPDSVSQLTVWWNDLILLDTLFSKGTIDSVSVSNDYLSPGLGALKVTASGTLWGKDSILYETDTAFTIQPGVSAAIDLILKKTILYRLTGLCFSPYLNGQNPDNQDVVSEQQLRERMVKIAPFTTWIRTFGSTLGMEKAGKIAHELGLKIAMGAWIGDDDQTNQREIDSLKKAALNGEVDIAVIGNEMISRGDISESALINYISQFKTAAQGIPVTTVDIYTEIRTRPTLIDACDLIMVNIYPFWESKSVDCAVSDVYQAYQTVVAVAGEKTIWLSETGWPDAGDPRGDAIPSPENAQYFFLNFVSMAREEGIPYFYFETYDEEWKANSEVEPDVGPHWGLWYNDLTLKPGLRRVFDNMIMSDNWSGTGVIDGPGTPEIYFTEVPPYGDGTGLVKGAISHVIPVDNAVAIYIKVGGGWWTKPYFNNPITLINNCGRFQNRTVTGGSDQNATNISVFLIPKTYTPPQVGGASSLPQELFDSAVVWKDTLRV
ncbi:MAG: hypothetical protein JXB48_24195 [Candidatus Latescibacteria bacterium]|nr:hypothetical protein [Candidatus Latescibacterota bacterium]